MQSRAGERTPLIGGEHAVLHDYSKAILFVVIGILILLAATLGFSVANYYSSGSRGQIQGGVAITRSFTLTAAEKEAEVSAGELVSFLPHSNGTRVARGYGVETVDSVYSEYVTDQALTVPMLKFDVAAFLYIDKLYPNLIQGRSLRSEPLQFLNAPNPMLCSSYDITLIGATTLQQNYFVFAYNTGDKKIQNAHTPADPLPDTDSPLTLYAVLAHIDPATNRITTVGKPVRVINTPQQKLRPSQVAIKVIDPVLEIISVTYPEATIGHGSCAFMLLQANTTPTNTGLYFVDVVRADTQPDIGCAYAKKISICPLANRNLLVLTSDTLWLLHIVLSQKRASHLNVVDSARLHYRHRVKDALLTCIDYSTFAVTAHFDIDDDETALNRESPIEILVGKIVGSKKISTTTGQHPPLPRPPTRRILPVGIASFTEMVFAFLERLDLDPAHADHDNNDAVGVDNLDGASEQATPTSNDNQEPTRDRVILGLNDAEQEALDLEASKERIQLMRPVAIKEDIKFSSLSVFSFPVDRTHGQHNTSGLFMVYDDRTAQERRIIRALLVDEPAFGTYALFSVPVALSDDLQADLSVNKKKAQAAAAAPDTVVIPSCDDHQCELDHLPAVSRMFPTYNNRLCLAFENWNQPKFASLVWRGGTRLAGIAQQDASNNDSVDVVLRGISTAHSKLYPGYQYYSSIDGKLTLSNRGSSLPFPIGVALSDTELLLNDQLFNQP